MTALALTCLALAILGSWRLCRILRDAKDHERAVRRRLRQIADEPTGDWPALPREFEFPHHGEGFGR